MTESGSYQGLIFDLDGTLWDTTKPVTLAWSQAASNMGPDAPKFTEEEIAGLMGMTGEEISQKVFPKLSEEKRKVWTDELYRREMEVLNQKGGTLYPGVVEGLRKLSELYPLFLVSNCQTDYLKLFLKGSGVGDCFQDSECYGGTGNPKGMNIRAVMDRNSLLSAAYVGDTAGDQKAAAFAHAEFYHAAYGFGAPDSECMAFDHFSELVRFFSALKQA